MLVGVLAIWVIARAVRTDGPAPAQAAPSEPADALTDHVNDVLGLRASSVAELVVGGAPHTVLSARVPIASKTYTLELEPHAVRAGGYRVYVQRADGSLEEHPPGAPHTYRGRLVGVEGSLVAASVEADGLHARIILPDGDEYWVEPVAARVPGAAPNAHAVYRGDDVIPSTARCDAHEGLRVQAAQHATAYAGESACGSGLCIAEVACDADVEYFQRWGTPSAVEDRINAVINAVNLQYERDVSVRHVISAIVIRTSEPDPYASIEPVTLLNQFRSEWLSNHGNVPRDTAQLFTGKALAGNVIGIAWLNAMCGSYGFSVVEADFTGNFAGTTDLSAHELGHNWAAGHCDCADPPYTMNSYITSANQFNASLTIPDIESFRDAVGCLTPGAACQVDADCDDGLFCTGIELCNAGVCDTNGDPCPGEDCDEDADQCVPRICNDDGTCEGEEDCQNCPGDCIAGTGSVCGNSACETGAGENCLTCPQDCNGRQGGRPTRRYCCGNGGYNPIPCNDDRCTSGGKTCTDTPGTPSCCGDGICQGIEDSCLCEIDCGPPPQYEVSCQDAVDNDCDGNVDCSDSDCIDDASCQNTASCGDGLCDAGEDCMSCADDCPGKKSGKRSGRFCCGDGLVQEPEALNPGLCGGND